MPLEPKGKNIVTKLNKIFLSPSCRFGTSQESILFPKPCSTCANYQHYWSLKSNPLSPRYESNSGGEREIQRTMLELLNQLDGFDSRGDVKVTRFSKIRKISFFICLCRQWINQDFFLTFKQVVMATNRIETLDPALIRPGEINDWRKLLKENQANPFHVGSTFFCFHLLRTYWPKNRVPATRRENETTNFQHPYEPYDAFERRWFIRIRYGERRLIRGRYKGMDGRKHFPRPLPALFKFIFNTLHQRCLKMKQSFVQEIYM